MSTSPQHPCSFPAQSVGWVAEYSAETQAPEACVPGHVSSKTQHSATALLTFSCDSNVTHRIQQIICNLLTRASQLLSYNYSKSALLPNQNPFIERLIMNLKWKNSLLGLDILFVSIRMWSIICGPLLCFLDTSENAF